MILFLVLMIDRAELTKLSLNSYCMTMSMQKIGKRMTFKKILCGYLGSSVDEENKKTPQQNSGVLIEFRFFVCGKKAVKP